MKALEQATEPIMVDIVPGASGCDPIAVHNIAQSPSIRNLEATELRPVNPSYFIREANSSFDFVEAKIGWESSSFA